MSAPFKDDSYRLPHYGRDGIQVIPDPLKGWMPPPIPDWPIPVEPGNLMPGIPVIPGLPWWVDPRFLPEPQPLQPEPLHPQMPLRPSAPSSQAGRTSFGDAGGLLGLLQDVMLRHEAQQRASAAGLIAPINDQHLGIASGKPMRFWPVQPPLHFPD